MRGRIAILAALAATVAGCGSSGPTISGKNLGALVLQRSDLSRQFGAFYRGPQHMVDQSPGRTDPTRYGREGGWIVRFRRAGGPATKGPLVLASRVDVFKDAKGAKQDFAAYRGYFSVAAGKPVSVPKIGDDVVATTSGLGGGKTAVVTYSIAWRHANATASVDVNGFARGLTLADAVALARKQDLRLRAALH